MPNSPANDEGEGGVQLADVEELERRCAELDDRHKRALADLDNYRKRASREVERLTSESRDAIVLDWLEAVDSVERALLMAEPESSLAVGLRAVLEQMQAILERQGIKRIGEEGETFDPERHEAVGVVATSEGPDRRVLEVARSGYAVGDRVLRPAQVIVSRREGPER
ncbi:MAG: molecular chaperone GrpE [Thermoleophilaceae bacterium]|jgi:molecular chaperone GrpE|nr:molecular chaperone GrpE [Thermoleophilaceae bacterium]